MIEDDMKFSTVGLLLMTTFTPINYNKCLVQAILYRNFPAIRRGFRPSRMTSNYLISPMKFC